MNDYIGGKKASELLGVHPRTLYLWDKNGSIETIRTPGGKRLYNVKKYLNSIEKNKSNVSFVNNPNINNKLINKNNYIYARVSSIGQKEDLERQIKVLSNLYPNYKIITDIDWNEFK